MSKVFFQVFNLELRRLITYRSDFWVNFIGQIFFSLVIAYFLWESIFSHNINKSINGYTITHMIFYYLCAPLFFRIQQGQGIGFISREIYAGEINKFLIYPIKYFSFKLSTYLANSFFIFVQLIILLVVYNLFFYDPKIYSFSIISSIQFLSILIICSISFFYLFSIVELLAFWFDNIWSLAVILRFTTSFLGGVLIPISFFPNWAQEIIYLTPFPYYIDFPMKALTGKLLFQEYLIGMIIIFAWLICFYFIAKLTWKKGNYSYTGVGI